jgi:hypothetical protein
MISLTPIVSRPKTNWYKHKKNKKLTLNSQLQTYQILTNDDQMLILRLSYFITTSCTCFVLGSNPVREHQYFCLIDRRKYKSNREQPVFFVNCSLIDLENGSDE